MQHQDRRSSPVIKNKKKTKSSAPRKDMQKKEDHICIERRIAKKYEIHNKHTHTCARDTTASFLGRLFEEDEFTVDT